MVEAALRTEGVGVEGELLRSVRHRVHLVDDVLAGQHLGPTAAVGVPDMGLVGELDHPVGRARGDVAEVPADVGHGRGDLRVVVLDRRRRVRGRAAADAAGADIAVEVDRVGQHVGHGQVEEVEALRNRDRRLVGHRSADRDPGGIDRLGHRAAAQLHGAARVGAVAGVGRAGRGPLVRVAAVDRAGFRVRRVGEDAAGDRRGVDLRLVGPGHAAARVDVDRGRRGRGDRAGRRVPGGTTGSGHHGAVGERVAAAVDQGDAGRDHVLDHRVVGDADVGGTRVRGLQRVGDDVTGHRVRGLVVRLGLGDRRFDDRRRDRVRVAAAGGTVGPGDIGLVGPVLSAHVGGHIGDPRLEADHDLVVRSGRNHVTVGDVDGDRLADRGDAPSGRQRRTVEGRGGRAGQRLRVHRVRSVGDLRVRAEGGAVGQGRGDRVVDQLADRRLGGRVAGLGDRGRAGLGQADVRSLDVALVVDPGHVRGARVVRVDVVLRRVDVPTTGVGVGLVLTHSGRVDVGVLRTEGSGDRHLVGQGLGRAVVDRRDGPLDPVHPAATVDAGAAVADRGDHAAVVGGRQLIPDLDVLGVAGRLHVHLVGDDVAAAHGHAVDRRIVDRAGIDLTYALGQGESRSDGLEVGLVTQREGGSRGVLEGELEQVALDVDRAEDSGRFDRGLDGDLELLGAGRHEGAVDVPEEDSATAHAGVDRVRRRVGRGVGIAAGHVLGVARQEVGHPQLMGVYLAGEIDGQPPADRVTGVIARDVLDPSRRLAVGSGLGDFLLEHDMRGALAGRRGVNHRLRLLAVVPDPRTRRFAVGGSR